MNNVLLHTLELLFIASILIIFIIGFTKKVVIFYDFKDLLINLIPVGSFILYFILLYIYRHHKEIEIFISVAIIAIIIFFIAYSVKLSIFYNRNIFIGIIIGLFRVFIATIGSILLLYSISNALGTQKEDESYSDFQTRKIGGAILTAILTIMFYFLINGKEVYNKKGWKQISS